MRCGDVRLSQIEDNSIVNVEPVVILTDEERSSVGADLRALDLKDFQKQNLNKKIFKTEGDTSTKSSGK